ncbi:hypothetical protein [Methylocystis rosea]|uniref:hypothetical protein n=1 Tax=Methylocystis rosea TaxID=173366 RepID=UPI00036CD01E|nr:hypothetical protein [Methylocystis rosea]
MTPLEFAREPASKWETCGGFVARWLEATGVRARTPTTAEILYRWRMDGVLIGAENQFALMGLERCDPEPNCVAVAEQDGDGPLVGVIDDAGRFVTRAFGSVALKREPRILAAWRIPGAPHV